MSIATARPLRPVPPISQTRKRFAQVLVARLETAAAFNRMYAVSRRLTQLARRGVNALRRTPSWAAAALRGRMGVLLHVSAPTALVGLAWAATSSPLQKLLAHAARWFARQARRLLLGVVDVAQWALYSCGGWGRRATLRIGFAVEWVDSQAARAATAVARAAQSLSGSRRYMQVVHDLSTVVLAQQATRRLLPGRWRLLAAPISLLLFGGDSNKTAAVLLGRLIKRLVGATEGPGTLKPAPSSANQSRHAGAARSGKSRKRSHSQLRRAAHAATPATAG